MTALQTPGFLLMKELHAMHSSAHAKSGKKFLAGKTHRERPDRYTEMKSHFPVAGVEHTK
jgi:hypothetical protein